MISRNIKLFKIDNFFRGFSPVTAILIVFIQSVTNSYTLSMVAMSLTLVTQAVLEVPTGTFSDKIGRKKTIVFSNIFLFLSFLLWALASSYSSPTLIIIASVFYGVYAALASGADEAFMYETMCDINRSSDFDILFSRSKMFLQIGLGCGALTSALITYFFSLTTLAWVSVVPAFITLIVSLFYVEPNCNRQEERNTSSTKHFIKALKEIIKNKKLRFFAMIEISESVFYLTTYRFEGAYFATIVPIWVVNIIRLMRQLFATISFYIVAKLKRFNVIKVFFTSMLSSIGLWIVALFVNSGITPFIISTVSSFYGTATTSSSTILQNEYNSKQRATMKSIIAIFSTIFASVFMLLTGVIADAYSPYVALFFVVTAKLCVVIWSLRYLRK